MDWYLPELRSDKGDYIVRMQLIKGGGQGMEGRIYSHKVTGRGNTGKTNRCWGLL